MKTVTEFIALLFACVSLSWLLLAASRAVRRVVVRRNGEQAALDAAFDAGVRAAYDAVIQHFGAADLDPVPGGHTSAAIVERVKRLREQVGVEGGEEV